MPEIYVPNEQMATTFFASDMHFNHVNIIKYCNRPFNNIQEMNIALVEGWNQTVEPDDMVFILGDICRPRHYQTVTWWLRQLNGQKVILKGNHDRGLYYAYLELDNIILTAKYMKLNTEAFDFYLVHDPVEAPIWWSDWVIHGHIHDKRPLVTLDTNLINVSVDVTGFVPISLSDIIRQMVEANYNKVEGVVESG